MKNRKKGRLNFVVGIEECKFGKQKYHRGYKINGLWVFGTVE